jgi:hypothetical protein
MHSLCTCIFQLHKLATHLSGHIQAQTLYFLGAAAGNGRHSAGAATRGKGTGTETVDAAAGVEDDADAGAGAACAGDNATAASKRRRGKRRKRGVGDAADAGADAVEADKENDAPPSGGSSSGKCTVSPRVGAAPGTTEVCTSDVSLKACCVAVALPSHSSSHTLPHMLCCCQEAEPEGEVVLTADNRSPIGEAYQFQRIAGGLARCGVKQLAISTPLTPPALLYTAPVCFSQHVLKLWKCMVALRLLLSQHCQS